MKIFPLGFATKNPHDFMATDDDESLVALCSLT